MKTMLRAFRVFPCVAIALSLTGCVKHISVSCLPEAPAIDNKDIANFGAIGARNIGFVNSSGASLGDVYQLTLTPSKEVFANPDRSITYSAADPNQFQRKEPSTQTLQVAISWGFDASAQSQVNSGQQAAIQASSPKTWNFNLSNATQVSLKSSVDQINQDAANADLKSHILNNPNSIFMVLNPAIQGDSLELKVDEKSNFSGSSSIKLGFLIKADVNYSCTSDLVRQKVTPVQPTILTYPELVKASDDRKSVVHAAGLNFPIPTTAVEVSVNTGPSESPKPAATPSFAVFHICKSDGSDAPKDGCKNK